MSSKRTLLDPAFGFFVWMVHLLVIYIGAAVACQLGVGTAGGKARTALIGGLVAVTLAALAVNALHARRRRRQQRGIPELEFRLNVTLGVDAVAAVAIAWQIMALLMLPLCR